MAFLQFPWRWLAVLTVASSLLLAFAVAGVKGTGGRRAFVLCLPLLLVPASYAVFRQQCDPDDTVAARQHDIGSGTGSEPTDEYTPLTADNDALQHPLPVAALVEDTDDPMTASIADTQERVTVESRTAEHWRMRVNSPVERVLVLRLRDYPAWRVRVNGVAVDGRPRRNDGLMALPVQAGPCEVEVSYRVTTDESVGDAVSAAALLVLLGMMLPAGLAARSSPRSSER